MSIKTESATYNSLTVAIDRNAKLAKGYREGEELLDDCLGRDHIAVELLRRKASWYRQRADDLTQLRIVHEEKWERNNG